MPDTKHFQDYLPPNNILCRVRSCPKEQIFQLLIGTLKRHYDKLDESLARTGILSREAEMPTVIAPGLAVPHARLPGLTEPLVALATVPDGVDFGSELGPVKVIVMVLSPLEAPHLHMQILAVLAGVFAQADAVEKVVACKTPVELLRYFSGGDAVAMPDFLKASDVMRPDVATVQESDTVQQAISIFARTGTAELVVIDRDGDMRGILALDDLLKLTLPEHLLWMEDLAPIRQLQPFAEMLKSSSDTKVADVMHEEFIKVDRNVPAIQLAKLFLVNKVRQLVITGAGGRLAGVVEFRDFCAKVFWE